MTHPLDVLASATDPCASAHLAARERCVRPPSPHPLLPPPHPLRLLFSPEAVAVVVIDVVQFSRRSVVVHHRRPLKLRVLRSLISFGGGDGDRGDEDRVDRRRRQRTGRESLRL